MSARINSFTSFFLDALRVFSALGVVAAHLATTRLVPDGGWVEPYGHCMVVCFFVLSGFLIRLSVEGREMDLSRYAALRLGRLWSVAVPCLAVAALLHGVTVLSGNVPAHVLQRDYEPLRYGITALFLNEVWFMSAGPSLNTPVWSLAYEAWYYAFFGVAMFVRHRGVRYGLLALMALIVGPKVLLLLPVWLTGVGLAWLFKRRDQLKSWAWPIFGMSVALATVWVTVHPRWPETVGHRPWFFSAAWGTDLVFGVAVAGLILGVDLLWGRRKPAPWLDGAVRRMAGVSFTLYLIHMPLMVFAAAMLVYDRHSVWQVGAILAAVLAIAFVFGSWIEPQRRMWTARLEAVFAALTVRVRSLHALVFQRVT